MKIALLTGAFKNAGDYLITERAEALLMHRYPSATISRYERNRNLESVLEDLNKSEVVVFAGGPGWLSNMYPEKFPLVSDLSELVPPVFALGMGCKTKNEKINRIAFSSQSELLIERLYNDGFHLGCRDVLTYRVLKESGLKNVLMTGCPAWYDLEYVHQTSLRSALAEGCVKKIAISDPANIINLQLAANLVSLCRDKYKPEEIVFTFHRGWNEDKYTSKDVSDKQQKLKAWLIQNKVRVVDLSYSAKGFSEYDDCDMHIGFRVHAHIYCLSHRIPSFLIEEDGRGFGVNESLGLAHIRSKKSEGILGRMQQYSGIIPERFSTIANDSRNTFSLLDKEINYEFASNWQHHLNAFRKMKKTFDVMCSHIDEISAKIN